VLKVDRPRKGMGEKNGAWKVNSMVVQINEINRKRSIRLFKQKEKRDNKLTNKM
jgi:hypothetical protein